MDVTRYFAGVSWLIPEMLLGLGSAFLLLFETFAPRGSKNRPAWLAAAILGMALAMTVLLPNEGAPATRLFSGMIVLDPFAQFFRVLFLVAGLLGVMISVGSEEISAKVRPEYFAMFLALVLGMMLMAEASDLVMMFIAIELVSLMSYVLVGSRRRDQKSAEAALKYVIYGGAASGVMVFGFSILYGLTGQTQLSLINVQVVELARETARLSLGSQSQVAMPLAVGGGIVLSFAGFLYKIAAVPLHMWSPDVYEGAPTPFTAFLSTGPKAAGFAAILRFFVVGFSDRSQFEANLLADVSTVPWLLLVIVVAILTMTVGNLSAIGQSNIKRFLAYSSIAHAGYGLIGVAAFSRAGASSVLFYMSLYVLMNMGAFYAVIWVQGKTGSDLINDYQGLGYRAPFVAVTMTVCLFSLTGLPPLAGFIGKYYVFAAALERGLDFVPLARCAPALQAEMGLANRLNCALSGGGVFFALAIAGVVNSAISLYYYARVVRKMFLEKPKDHEDTLHVDLPSKLILGPISALLIVFGLYWSPLSLSAKNAIAFEPASDPQRGQAIQTLQKPDSQAKVFLPKD